MANKKVHPQQGDGGVGRYLTSSQPETFTIWMKSLVLSGNGCTVFDSKGEVVYRVDNYNRKCCNQLHLMDFNGNLLFTILKKRFKLVRLWEGYRCSDYNDKNNIIRRKMMVGGFEVKQKLGVRLAMLIRRRKDHHYYSTSNCKVVVNDHNNINHDQQQQQQQVLQEYYEMEDTPICLQIVDKQSRHIIAQVKRKESTRSGVVLGEDVLTMVVQPHIDHSLIMALFLVSTLISSKL